MYCLAQNYASDCGAIRHFGWPMAGDSHGRNSGELGAKPLAHDIKRNGRPKHLSSIGNPDLKATHANNYDILFEQYLKPLGLFTAGFFYKDTHRPRSWCWKRPGRHLSGLSRELPAGSARTTPEARTYGAGSAAYQQRWSFLPGALGGLGFSGNYSYTSSANRRDFPAVPTYCCCCVRLPIPGTLVPLTIAVAVGSYGVVV